MIHDTMACLRAFLASPASTLRPVAGAELDRLLAVAMRAGTPIAALDELEPSAPSERRAIAAWYAFGAGWAARVPSGELFAVRRRCDGSLVERGAYPIPCDDGEHVGRCRGHGVDVDVDELTLDELRAEGWAGERERPSARAALAREYAAGSERKAG